MAWDGGVGANAFDIEPVGPWCELDQNGNRHNSVSVGNLAAGTYTFTVTAKNNTTTNTSGEDIYGYPGYATGRDCPNSALYR